MLLYDAHGRAIERRRRIGFVLTGDAYGLVPSAPAADAIASERVAFDEEEAEVCAQPKD